MSKTDSNKIDVTRDLLMKYDKSGPRYTSYPTRPEWKDDFGDEGYREALADSTTRPDDALAMYIHIPFCHERCIYCGCNVIVSKREGLVDKYLDYLDREMGMAAEVLGKQKQVMQLHWGGGTPTYLNIEKIERLYSIIKKNFNINEKAEIALEIDPRVTTKEQLIKLRELGFNRISMGVQDLNPKVQEAITRGQTEEETVQLYEWCRETGFSGINFDMIYGLPYQKPEDWEVTIDKIIKMRPDRLAVYSYAHVPWMRPEQKKIPEDALPIGPKKFELFAMARTMFVNSGYQAIGMDHFALPDDELSIAMNERRLHRNFMGYTVIPASEMIGFGVSSIGEIGNSYVQTETKLVPYYDAIDKGCFPVMAGCKLSEDDIIRRWVIRRLMCDFYLDTNQLEEKFGVKYSDYFANEEKDLSEFYDNNFVGRENGNIVVLPLGQVFIRNVTMVFDAYLKKPEGHKRFSRTV